MAWLERFPQSYQGTVVAITHDRYFLDNAASWILEMEHGRGTPYEGNYSGWLEQKQERLRQSDRQDAKRQRTLEHELEWVRMGAKARQSKGKARLTAYEQLLAEANEKAAKDDKLEIFIPSGPRLGDVVIEAQHVSKGFGDRLLIEDLEFTLPKAGIVGVIGANGAGKTTLFKMITGSEKPDDGELRVGPTVQLAYVDQSRDALDPERTAFEEITDGNEIIKLGPREMHARAYVAAFNFKGPDQQKKVGVCLLYTSPSPRDS